MCVSTSIIIKVLEANLEAKMWLKVVQVWWIHASKNLRFWFYNFVFALIRLWSVHEIFDGMDGYKKNCIKVIFLHRPHQTDTEANEASQRSHLCGSERKTVALHEAAALWTKLSTKSQINAFKVLATAPLGVAQNVTKEMSLKSNLHTKIPQHKANQSVSFISTQRAEHWEKKNCWGDKKNPTSNTNSSVT